MTTSFRHLQLFISALAFITPASGKNFTLGLLIPFDSSKTPGTAVGKLFAPAIVQAMDDISNSPDLLVGHHLSYIWNDTMCDEDESLRGLFYQIQEKHVSAVIGPGCSCKYEARLASALDIPMISYVSFVKVLLSIFCQLFHCSRTSAERSFFNLKFTGATACVS